MRFAAASDAHEQRGPGPDFLAIVGPTAAGKTALSIAVARRLGGEIVSMDSRQIYRGMDIGTAKANAAERRAVPHHGLDLRAPGERYSAGEFARDARRWIGEIRARGRVAILAGGTGFFLRALMRPLFHEPPLDPKRRAALEAHLAHPDRSELARWVRRLDPQGAAQAIAGGRQRMVRALVVALLSGRSLPEWQRHRPAEAEPLQGPVFLMELPMEVLDRRIARRVRRMMAAGLADEVTALLAAGVRPDDPGMKGVGYREVIDALEGRCTMAAAAERIRIATRQYARRQRTWFRHQLPPERISIDGEAPLAAQAEAVTRAWTSGFGAVGARQS